MSLKSWGLELWDQIDKVFTYCQQGQDQLDLLYKTLTDYHKIYTNLTRKHKALVVPITNGKTKLILDKSTYLTSFDGVLQCIAEQASIYEQQSDDIKEKCLIPLKSMFDELKSTLNVQASEYGKFKTNVETQKRLLDRAWAKYFTAFNVKKKGEIAYNKIKDDKTVPRVDIEKVQNQSSQKKADFEKTRSEYAEVNQKYNEAVAQLYLKDLPTICSALEMVDRKRCEITMQVGLDLVAIQQINLDKTKEVSATKLAAEFSRINAKQDAEDLVKLRSGLFQPPDMVFIDLEKIPPGVGGGSSEPAAFKPDKIEGLLQQGGKAGKGDVPKSLFAGNGLKGFELPDMLPEQINKRAHHIQESIKAVEKQLSGLQNLYQTFEKDPQMGDKNSLDPEVDVNKRQLLSLQEMETEILSYIDQNEVGIAKPVKPEPFQSDDVDTDPEFPDTDEDDDMTAIVLYTFEAIDAQQMSVTKGEKVIIVKYDEGNSGWTLAKSMTNSNLTGFVPTNYIEIENQ